MSKRLMKIPKKAMYFAEDDADMHLARDEDGRESFSMLAYSGKIIKGYSFWGDLAVDVSGIQFNGKRFPILEQHELDKKIGVSNKKPTIESGVFFEKINLLNNPVAQEFRSNLDGEFPYQASLGIHPLAIEELSDGETAEVNGYKMKGPGTIIRKSRFKEASVCVFGADPNTKIASLSEEEEEVLVELVEKTTNETKEMNKTEEKSMTLKELQEKYPELYAEIQRQLSEKEAKIQELSDKMTEVENKRKELESENTALSDENQINVQRIEKLEKLEDLRREKDIKNQADGIVSAKLSENNIPVRLHEKIRKQLDHNMCVSEENVFDSAKFTEQVDAEIKDWKETLGEFTVKKDTVLGMSGGDRTDFSEQNSDDDASRLLNYVSEKTVTDKE